MPDRARVGAGGGGRMRPVWMAILPLAACAPVPVERAEQSCLEEARLARAPRGEVSVGVWSGGRVGASAQVDISSDFVIGRDPEEVFARCVLRRSGQMPTRPLDAQPGWTG